jgi:hypothetical protein
VLKAPTIIPHRSLFFAVRVADPPAQAGGFSVALGAGAELKAGLRVRPLPGTTIAGCDQMSVARVATAVQEGRRRTSASSTVGVSLMLATSFIAPDILQVLKKSKGALSSVAVRQQTSAKARRSQRVRLGSGRSDNCRRS